MMTPEQLYTLAAQYLEIMEQKGSDALSDEQHTLLAFVYLDNEVQDGGFVQLLASGWGSYIFDNPVADSLWRWRVKAVPKVLDKVKPLYQKFGEQIEQLAEDGAQIADLRARFPDFEEWDGEFYDCVDDDFALIGEYVAANLAKFQAA